MQRQILLEFGINVSFQLLFGQIFPEGQSYEICSNFTNFPFLFGIIVIGFRQSIDLVSGKLRVFESSIGD